MSQSRLLLVYREFIETDEFHKTWKSLELSDKELIELQNMIMENPDCGTLIQGTGGLRKMRYSIHANKGKSGGIRVCYVDFKGAEKTILVTAFSKNVKESLSAKEKRVIKKLIEQLKQYYGGNNYEEE